MDFLDLLGYTDFFGYTVLPPNHLTWQGFERCGAGLGRLEGLWGMFSGYVLEYVWNVFCRFLKDIQQFDYVSICGILGEIVFN